MYSKFHHHIFSASFEEPVIHVEDAYINGFLRLHCPQVKVIREKGR